MEAYIILYLCSLGSSLGYLLDSQSANQNDSLILQLQQDVKKMQDEHVQTSVEMKDFALKLKEKDILIEYLLKQHLSQQDIINNMTMKSDQQDIVLRNLTAELSQQKFAKLEKEVAFLARFSQPRPSFWNRTIARNGPIIYDDITVNFGQGFNQTTGIFTTPVGGLYVFQLTSLAESYLAINLFAGGALYGTSSGLQGAQGSVQTVVRLNAGQTVLTQLAQGTGTLVGSRGYTQFSGVLLHSY
ncbi:uncharacterized protein LOC125379111 [Haliotis rufescens]|uniref:uncharacterized protein LOC125379111 n=1 Tax=Haliotis rufescens TaxID=6454 RepID=UPI00201F23D4|nr:uncharacterized protein LOC125379111 [Haliotis rufescens]